MPTPDDLILNVLPSPDADTDFGLDAALEQAPPSAVGPLPADADWSADWWPVANQGATGACVGYAVADGLLRRQFVEAGRLGHDERLSVRFIWMASKETDDLIERPTTFVEAAGTRLRAAVAVATRYGCVSDEVLPMDGTLYAGQTNTFYTLAERYRAVSYHNLSLSRSHTLDDWRRWLATFGPLAVRLNADETFMQPRGGVLDVYRGADANNGHVTVLAGYDADGFLVRNSWSGEWGNSGYAVASDAYAAAAFDECYGVVVAAGA